MLEVDESCIRAEWFAKEKAMARCRKSLDIFFFLHSLVIHALVGVRNNARDVVL